MNLAQFKQNIFDWSTQQWVILTGKRIYPGKDAWLIGPFGNLDEIGRAYIQELAQKENLIIHSNNDDKGLIPNISDLILNVNEYQRLSDKVIDFYENTSAYDFDLKVKWNPIFKGFGIILKIIFSHRLNQLNVPLNNPKHNSKLKSEIIQLLDPSTQEVRRTFWLRSFANSQQVVYAGIYEIGKTPYNKTCIKAIFPLPNGNATVILYPMVNKDGSLFLISSGKKFGDSGFYFLLKDAKGDLWSKYIPSFQDELRVCSNGNHLIATQRLTLWNIRVLTFKYNIKRKESKF